MHGALQHQNIEINLWELLGKEGKENTVLSVSLQVLTLHLV